ncbi:MAG: hypothetical protein AUJ28_00465 [Parcubacteria group bacterium CG1_02_37_51]|nr:MAG: hypothetical protein AUJ28_00465 [Parcubacteria group bacterium CG1_02_37_51]
MIKLFNRKSRGFTIMELIVSIGVFMSLFLMVTVNFRTAESSNDLRLETQKIASDIRKLQTLALTGSTYNYNGTSTEMGIGGFGVKFSNGSTTYAIYSDTAMNYGVLDQDDVLLESVTLASDFSNILITTEGSDADAYLTFLPRSSMITFKTIIGESIVDLSAQVLRLEIYHNKVANKKGVIEITPISGQVNFYLE